MHNRTKNYKLLMALLPITMLVSAGIWWGTINWEPLRKIIMLIFEPFGTSNAAVGSLFILILACLPLLLHGQLLRRARKKSKALSDYFHCPSCGYATWASGLLVEDPCSECGFVRPNL
jgi:hypothetical protein